MKTKKNGVAIIIDTILAHDDIENGKSYYPVILYEIEDKEYTKVISSMSGKFQIGNTVDIIYNSEKPDNVNIKPSFIYMITGIIFSIAGVFLIKNKKNKKSKKK